MNKDRFSEVFLRVLEEAAQNIKNTYHVDVPREYVIEFHGLGSSGELMDIETALDKLYLGDDLFLFLVDVAVLRTDGIVTVVYVGVSGHGPSSTFEETWNTPPGNGPFKQILSLQFQTGEGN